MNTLVERFGAWLAESSWQAAVLVALVILAQWLFGRALQPRWRYLLWFLVLGRLLLPSLPESPVSVYRYVPATPTKAVEPLNLSFTPPFRPPTEPFLHSAGNRPSVAQPSYSWSEIALIVWAIGATGLLTVFIWRNLSFYRKLKSNSEPVSEWLNILSSSLCEELHLRQRPIVLETDCVDSPAAVGLFHPRLLLPKGLASTLSQDELSAVLLHELAHVKRGDLWVHFLVSIVQIIHWFNPVLWWAFARMRVDRELATDSLALTRATDTARESYGKTLLKLLTTQPQGRSLQPSIGILENHRKLKQRIEQIAHFSPKAYAWSVLGIILIFGLGTFALTQCPLLKKKNLPPIPTLTQEREEVIQQFLNRVQEGDIKLVEEFLDRGLDVNSNNQSDNALYTATHYQNVKMVKLLLSRGARVNDKTSWGDQPVKRALWLGNKPIADILISAGAECPPILYAAGTGDIGALEKLYAKGGIDRKKQTFSAINFAAASGHIKALDWLWKQAEPFSPEELKKKQQELFDIACNWGRLTVIQYLEQHGFDVQASGESQLHCAATGNHPDVVKYLFEKGVTLSPEKAGEYGLLRNAAGEGHLEIVRLLLDHGANINIQTESGDTPLRWAAERGNTEVCRLLIERGADISIRDSHGWNAAWGAAFAGASPDTLELLIKKGIDIKTPNKDGATILNSMQNFVPAIPGKVGWPGKMYTEAESKELDVKLRRTVFLLADAGADLNAQGFNGTPLMTALNGGHSAIAQALIEKGADINIRDKAGNTALSIAISAGGWGKPLNVDLIELLLKKGANIQSLYRPQNATMTKRVNGQDVPVEIPPTPLINLAINSPCQSTPAYKSEHMQAAQEAVKVLVRHGAQFSTDGNAEANKWLTAAALGDLTALKKMSPSLINGEDSEGWTALMIALSLGYDEVTDWLLKQGASVKRAGASPLYIAASRKREDWVNLFLANGADPRDAIPAALSMGDLVLFNRLVKAGADLKGFGDVIFTCIQNGQPEMARIFLENGASPEFRHNSEKRENVYWAVYYNQPEILQMILDRGADPTLKTIYDETPLSYSKQFRPHMVPMLEAAIKKWEIGHPKASGT